MINFFSKEQKSTSFWNILSDVSQFEEIDQKSEQKPVLIFKHSTRCGISAMALSRFERSYREDAKFEPYFLDLIANRDLSNEVAQRYGIVHESPQTILVSNRKAIYDSSHNGIDFEEINKVAEGQ